ncbi:MAG TPA: SOS response-associated peptidase [Kiritimatiellia bacterium]|nr:SOS response-associated peptidase [Kiritimatiellia bacterium]HMP34953.1 SOS response-associated peptidase [Kiritimatiellia bacterium]
MCGRLVLTSSITERIKALLGGLDVPTGLVGRYNVAPTQPLLAMTDPSMASFTPMTWGFPPAHRDGGSLLINARSETVDRLASFREAFSHRRCLVWADGFYEWKRAGLPRPQPYFFYRTDRAPFAIAGLWSPIPEASGAAAVVITTEANQVMHPVHDRMPVILHPDGASLWLAPEVHPETLKALLQPFPSSAMACHPVSDRVNRSSAEGAALLEPVTIYEQRDLF